MLKTELSRSHVILALVAGGALAASALAGPTHRAGSVPSPLKVTKERGVLKVAQPKAAPKASPNAPLSENFDSYAAGSLVAGQGGWEVWYTGGVDGTVSTEQAASPKNSMRVPAFGDMVHRFGETSGKWVFKVKTYVPGPTAGGVPGTGGYVIMMNQYGGPDNWSVQIALNDLASGPPAQQDPWKVESQFDGAVLDLVTDAWKEVRVEIDLGADTVNSFYDDKPLGVGLKWTDNQFGSGPGILQIANCDLFSNGVNPMYFDDVSFQPGGSPPPPPACAANCNGDTDPVTGKPILNVLDFNCFQNAFALGDLAKADVGGTAGCTPDGALTISDFSCFQNLFALGCP